MKLSAGLSAGQDKRTLFPSQGSDYALKKIKNRIAKALEKKRFQGRGYGPAGNEVNERVEKESDGLSGVVLLQRIYSARLIMGGLFMALLNVRVSGPTGSFWPIAFIVLFYWLPAPHTAPAYTRTT